MSKTRNSMRIWRALIAMLPAAAVGAITGARAPETTATQAVISYTAPSDQACTVEVSESATYAPLVNDVNPGLFPGANLDSRPGAVAQRNRRWFVVGKRAAEKAVDNRYYSRALQANTRHYYRIRCGADSLSGDFLTVNPPLGNTAPDVYPADPKAPGQYAWPTFDYTDPNKWYIDPLTGIAVKPASFPWQTFLHKTALQAAAAYGTGWTAAQNAAAPDGAYASYSGRTREPVFVQLGMSPDASKSIAQVADNGAGAIRVTITGHGYSTDNTVVIGGVPGASGVNGYWKIMRIDADNFDLKNSVASGGLPAAGGTATRLTEQMTLGTNHGAQLSWNNSSYTTDLTDFQVSITGYCNAPECQANVSERQIDICLTVDAVSCATDWKTVTLPTTNGAVAFPATFPNPGLQAAWLGGAFQTPIAAQDLPARAGLVTVSGTSVTRTSGDLFNTDRWTAGSLIAISGQVCRIGSVEDTSHLTLATACGATGWYEANNFGLLVRKTSTSAAILNIDGVTYKAAGASQYTNGASGTSFPCINTAFADSTGKGGFVCPMGSSRLIFIASDGEVRQLGKFGLSWHQAGKHGNSVGFYQGESLDNRHPVWMVTAGDDDGVHTHLFRAIYHSDGRSGCADPTGFRQPADPSLGSCLIEWQDMTGDLYGGDLGLNATMAAHASGMGGPALSGIVGDYGVFTRSSGGDCPAWLTIRDLKSMQWTQAFSTYTDYPFRWCLNHSEYDFRGGRPYWGLSLGDYAYSCNFSGKWSVATRTAIGIDQRDSCDAVTDPRWASLARQNGCAVVDVAGEPCKSNPTAWEIANLPACSWNAGARKLQDAAEGDQVSIDSERFIVGKVLSPTRWLLIRNYNPGCNAWRDESNGSAYANHVEGAIATMGCAAVCRANTHAYIDLSNPTSRIVDMTTSPTGHSDSAIDAMVRGWQNTKRGYALSLTARYGDLATAASKPVTVEIGMSASFAGAKGLGQGTYVQSHMSHRQILAADKKWITDFNPLGPNAGQGTGLWAHNAVRVEGDLLKIKTPVSLASRKKLPLFGFAGKWALTDISGPGARISGGPGDAWKMCVADFAGECVAASGAGDVYLNVPRADLAPASCQRTFAWHSPCFGQANWDFGFLTQMWAEKSAKTMIFGRHLTAGFQYYGGTMTYANGKAVPDGSLVLLNGDYINGVRSDILMAKVPPKPQAEESTNRTTFVEVSVQRGAAPAGASTAVVEFGYDPSFRCTSRAESCIANQATVNEAAPFYFASEPYTGVSCAGGFKIAIPAIPQRILYYRVLYKTADGTALPPDVTNVAVAP